jgi:uncharacterized protein YpiB (UPF0302 family)
MNNFRKDAVWTLDYVQLLEALLDYVNKVSNDKLSKKDAKIRAFQLEKAIAAFLRMYA